MPKFPTQRDDSWISIRLAIYKSRIIITNKLFLKPSSTTIKTFKDEWLSSTIFHHVLSRHLARHSGADFHHSEIGCCGGKAFGILRAGLLLLGGLPRPGKDETRQGDVVLAAKLLLPSARFHWNTHGAHGGEEFEDFFHIQNGWEREAQGFRLQHLKPWDGVKLRGFPGSSKWSQR